MTKVAEFEGTCQSILGNEGHVVWSHNGSHRVYNVPERENIYSFEGECGSFMGNVDQVVTLKRMGRQYQLLIINIYGSKKGTADIIEFDTLVGESINNPYFAYYPNMVVCDITSCSSSLLNHMRLFNISTLQEMKFEGYGCREIRDPYAHFITKHITPYRHIIIDMSSNDEKILDDVGDVEFISTNMLRHYNDGRTALYRVECRWAKDQYIEKINALRGEFEKWQKERIVFT